MAKSTWYKSVCQMKAAAYIFPAILGLMSLVCGMLVLLNQKFFTMEAVGMILVVLLGICLLRASLLFWIAYFGIKKTHPGDWNYLASCIFSSQKN